MPDVEHCVNMNSISPWNAAFEAARDGQLANVDIDAEYDLEDFEQGSQSSNDQKQRNEQHAMVEDPVKIPPFLNTNYVAPDADSLEHFAMNLFEELDILEPDNRLTFNKPIYRHQFASRSEDAANENADSGKSSRPKSFKSKSKVSDEKPIQKVIKTQVVEAYCAKALKPSQIRMKELSKPKIPLITQFCERGRVISEKPNRPKGNEVNHTRIEDLDTTEKNEHHGSSDRPPWIEITHKDYSYLSPRFKTVIREKAHIPRDNVQQHMSDEPERILTPRPPTPSSRPSSNKSRVGRIHENPSIGRRDNDNPTELAPHVEKTSKTVEAKPRTASATPQNANISNPPADDPFASKPLQWSRKFGDNGRKAVLIKKQSKKEIKPPPCLSEDLIDILKPMIMSIIHSFFESSIAATSYSDEYSSWLDKFFLANNRDFSRDETIKSNLKSLELIITSISNSEFDEMEKDRSSTQNDQMKDWCRSFQNMIELFTSIPNRRSYDELCICIIWLLRRKECGVAQFLKSESLLKMLETFGLFLADVRETVVDGTDWQCDRGINKSKMDRKQLRAIFDRLRNLHIFESKEYELDNKVMDTVRLQTGASTVQGSVYAGSIFTSSISPTKSMMSPSILHVTGNHEISPVHTTKLSGQSVIMKQVVQMDDTKLNTLFNINGQHMMQNSEVVSPNKPTSAGRIRPLGEGKMATVHAEPSSRKRLAMQQLADVKNILTFGDHANMIEGHKNSEYVGGQRHSNAMGREQVVFEQIKTSEKFVASLQSVKKTSIPTFAHSGKGKITVLCGTHIGMVAFRNIAPSDFVNRPSKFTAQLDKYYQKHNFVMEEVFSSPPHLPDYDDNVQNLKTERKAKQKLASKLDDHVDNNNFSEDHETNLAESPSASIGVFHDCSDESDNEAPVDALGPLRPPNADLNMSFNQSENYDSHHLFLTSAPNLSQEQKSLLFIALLSDIIRSFLLQVTVIVRHALAGKAVGAADLKMIFGRKVFATLPKRDIGLLIKWLRANQRTELNFRPSNALIIELALQKLYSFWPSLSIKLTKNAAVCNSNECQISLKWNARNRIHKDFREPDSYQPNINRI